MLSEPPPLDALLRTWAPCRPRSPLQTRLLSGRDGLVEDAKRGALVTLRKVKGNGLP